jgi:hypothetical protein
MPITVEATATKLPGHALSAIELATVAGGQTPGSEGGWMRTPLDPPAAAPDYSGPNGIVKSARKRK